MTSSKSTKRALLTSALALLMCVTMLVGATFAWFTDTASTGVNKIQAGNLDIKVEYRTTADGNWQLLDNATDLFGAAGTLFEPGHTRVVELRITNAGNLALKYKIGMNVVSETAGTNKAGNPYKLSEYLKVSTTGIQQYNPTDQISSLMERLIFQKGDFGMWTARDFANFELEYTSNGNVHALQPGAAQILGIKVYMPETVGNEANAISTEKAASINFGLNVVATQYTVESDSFGTQYDKDATYPVTDNKGLKDAINNATDGSTVLITSGEYTLSDPAETRKIEIPAGATIAGAGADNTTLNVNNDKIAKDNVTLKDMTIKGSGSQGTGGTLNVNGNNTTIENIDYKGDGNIAIAVSTGSSNSGTTFRGTKITNAFRGIQFWSLSGDSVIDNCVLDVAGYTFNIDAAVAGSTLTITNSTLNGWTSYTSGIDLVTFDSCKLGLNAYSYLRPYSETMLVNCEFTSDGYQLNAGGSNAYTITLTNCTKNGTPITADNVKTLLLDTEDWNSNATLIVNGVTVSV